MAVSPSTPRIRFTQASYVLVVFAVALTGGRSLEGATGLLAQAVGFALVVAGTLSRMWASVFIAGRKDVELVEEGPYSRCRHPLYFGSLLAAAGIGLSTRSLVLAIAVPFVMSVLSVLAIRREEQFLAGHHGRAWEAYRARVPALLPGRSGARKPLRREVDLAVYFKSYLDAATMLGLWLLVVAIDALRSLGAWRAPWVLP